MKEISESVIIKNFFVIAGLLSIFLIINGCSGNSDSPADKNASGTLKMYMYSYDEAIQPAISRFNDFSSIKINADVVNGSSQAELEEYRNKITTSILAGEGPDIIVDYPATFPSLWKMAQNGAFCDLNEYIDKDSGFKLSDYYSQPMEGGVINGKRYFMPVSFAIQLMWSTEGILNKYGININEDNWTWEEFVKCFRKFSSANENRDDKYFAGATFGFESIILGCWPEFVDYSNKKTYFNSSAFMEMLEAYKAVYPKILPDSKLEMPELYFKFMKEESLIFVRQSSTLWSLWLHNTAVNKLLGSEMRVYPFPYGAGGTKINGQIYRFAAVNAASRYKEEAFEFVKLLLSEESQSKNEEEFSWLPVNKKAYERAKKKYAGTEGNDKSILNFSPEGSQQYTSVSLQDELLLKLDGYLNNMDRCSYIDNNILQIIKEEVQAYIAGRQDADQTARDIDNKSALYMEE